MTNAGLCIWPCYLLNNKNKLNQSKLHLLPLRPIVGAAKGFKGPYGGWEVANDNDLMSLSNDYRHGVNFCALGPHYDKAYFLNLSLE